MNQKSKPSFRLFAGASISLLGALCVLQACSEPAKDDGERSATEANRRPPETKRIDLGDGLELTERREFQDGKVAALLKTYRRNGRIVMTHDAIPDAKHEFRTYYRDGKQILSEEYDGNGNIFRLYVTADDGSPSELFERQIDGTTAPVSSKTLEKAKQAFSFIKRTFTPIAEAAKEGDKKAFRKHLDAAINEVEDARKAASENNSKAPSD
jgi:hypothetical protein